MKRIMQLFSVILILLSSTQVSAQVQWLEKFDLTQYENKVVYLDFWASWCGPCRKSFPWLNEMQAKYQDQGLVIIGINLDRDIKNANNFLNTFPANFRLYSDPQGLLATNYKVVGMPSSYLFSGDGELEESHIGFKKSKQKAYEASIVKLLQQLPNKQSKD
ncbi:MAG: cytochrome c biogenesis protein CcmG/thiol:disulfide interchange protein DsbE [Psychromonas sp.]|jgi:cytochrome c biogenesis protein CcmG/thiol:disulfide interchange protein DsbE|uniref:TlpA disulfide reductase family protein n=1 Tax=Psychromonas sp. TaxID=1884585 RepID=UPI0039E449EC